MKNLICILAIVLMTSTVFGQNETEMKEFDSNFSHTVFFWLKNPDNAADRTAFETSLKKFLSKSAYANTKFIGTPPKASRDVVDGSFTYSLILSFDSAESQQAYQDEAPHKVFIEESSDLWSKVIVYDSTGI